MSELDAIRIKIAETEAYLAAARTAGDKELIVAYLNILTEQQKEKNILLAGSAPVAAAADPRIDGLLVSVALLEIIKDPRIYFFGRNMPGSRSSFSGKEPATKDQLELQASKIAVRKSYQDCNGGRTSCLFCGRADGDPSRISMAHLVSSGRDDYSQLNVHGEEDNVNPRSTRNLIPLCGTQGAIGTCHHLFDNQAIALIYNPLKQGYGLHCFTPNERIKAYQEVALKVPHNCRPYQRVLNARAKACLKEFVGENLAGEISKLKSVTSLLVKTQMTDAFSNDVSQNSTRTQSIDDGDEIEDAGAKFEKSVVQYSKIN